MSLEGDDFEDVLAANAEYAKAFRHVDLDGRARRRLGLLTCIDSRIDPLATLGLEPGDAKIIRNAGARVTDDVVRTLVLATYLLDVERFMVIAHTDCRMVAASENELHRAIRAAGGPDTSDAPFGVTADQRLSLREGVSRIRETPHLEHVRVGGFLLDVRSGKLERVC
jgi:carbonic anhydrase